MAVALPPSTKLESGLHLPRYCLDGARPGLFTTLEHRVQAHLYDKRQIAGGGISTLTTKDGSALCRTISTTDNSPASRFLPRIPRAPHDRSVFYTLPHVCDIAPAARHT